MNLKLVMVISVALGLFSGCAKNKKLEQRLEESKKVQLELKLRQAELARQVEEFSHTLMLMEDSLERLMAKQTKSTKKSAVKWHRRKPDEDAQAKASKTKPPTRAKAESVFPVKPGDKNLPALTLTNSDLKTLDQKTSSESATAKISKTSRKSVNRVEENPDASDLYNRAFENYENKNYGKAVKELENFVQKYPKHRYADNAIYWMGESFYQESDYLKALFQFERLVKDYPKANKVPDALLRAGACHLRLSNRKGAQNSFQKLIENYPRSVAAKKANELLADLRKNQGKRRM